MAYEAPVLDFSFPAAADLTGKLYRVVRLAAGGTVDLAGQGAHGIGILQNNPLKDDAAAVRLFGISKAVADGVISLGAVLAPASNGAVKVASTGEYPIGIALQAAGAAGEIIAVLVTPSLVKA